jgi:hypothetical protein
LFTEFVHPGVLEPDHPHQFEGIGKEFDTLPEEFFPGGVDINTEVNPGFEEVEEAVEPPTDIFGRVGGI